VSYRSVDNNNISVHVGSSGVTRGAQLPLEKFETAVGADVSSPRVGLKGVEPPLAIFSGYATSGQSILHDLK
jgi:hypothetical protein